ncbi:hypothetical protein ACFOSC_18760 [Streptantibioticus rubrisoli]|uniref:Uncharacterized protein n=1 Tax=Streptantibioticus rubrisoli TaxID=1387313 RepID=A0ABT1PFI2_9ACTN|nr:hypothetical protein [Streptantibioticus rubrisoli]MCQ4043546.1 hypothetical protein [Streptantibioticus rubrisoli]
MSDSSVARRAIFVAAASALAVGVVSPTAFADDPNRFDEGHLNLNNGASCATKDATEIGWTLLSTGRLPKAFNDTRVTRGSDAVNELCHAVDSPPPGQASGPNHQPQGLFALAQHRTQGLRQHLPQGVAQHASKKLLGGLPVGGVTVSRH